MPVTPIAGTWQKFLLKAGTELGGAVAAYLLSRLSEGTEEVPAENLQWMRWTVEYSRTTPTGTSEDRAQFSFDVVNFTGGHPDYTYTTTDFTDIDSAISACGIALRPWQQPNHGLVRTSAHRMAFNPAGWPAKRFMPTGAPLYVDNYTPSVGTGSVGAYQVAATVTERTPFPGHWGRMYVPGLSSGALDTNGRISSAARTGILGAFETMYDALKAKEFYPVVPMTQHDKQPVFGLLSVEQLAVDDIPDVQRRRRPKQVAARSLST